MLPKRTLKKNQPSSHKKGEACFNPDSPVIANKLQCSAMQLTMFIYLMLDKGGLSRKNWKYLVNIFIHKVLIYK